MSTRTMRMAAAVLLCGLTAAPAFAQTAPAPQPRRFAITVGSGENQMVIYVDAMMMPRTATAAIPHGADPMGQLEAVTIGVGEGAMTVYRDASGRMMMTQTALMGAPAAISPRHAVTIGTGSSEMVVYVEEVQMTPSRR
ncbi:hypothetical protein KPL78_17505 [Roseomonas sp. HJA6]|uniref:Uncharacterized protein n=1 Tax=Roseomonas alba TaxID=2846776 RepID=A0ABS7AC72_9PROT|nr:hypothetical protein [Neoroseomonas alba]MBW6399660.1 hypothetical protein [Neoroseomonas alba]